MFSAFSNKFIGLPNNLKGALVLMIAAGLFVIMTTLIKFLGSNLHVTQILLVRQIVMTAIIAPVILKDFPGALKTKTPGLQIIRVGFALVAMTLGFTAIIELPLADATALGFAKSFFVSVFAVLILKEVVGIRRWAAVALGFVGVLVMLQPGTDGFNIYGLFAVIAAACAGLVMVLIRLMSKTEKSITILSWQAIGVGLVMIIPALYFWQWPTPYEWLLLICMGAVSYFAQLANITAYKLGEASMLASLDYIRLLYATLFGYFIFETLPSGTTWIGATIIVLAAVYTIYREAQKKQKLTRSPNGRGFTNQ